MFLTTEAITYASIGYSLHHLVLGTVPKGVPQAFWDQLRWQKVVLGITGGVIAAIVVPGVVGVCIAPTTTWAFMERIGFLIVFGVGAVHALVVLFGTRSALRRLSTLLMREDWRICMHCGYSLIGLPSPRGCPECGTVYTWEGLRMEWTHWLMCHGLKRSALEPGRGDR